MSFFTRQPGKTIYTVLTIIWCCIEYPFLLLWFIPKSCRQHPSWTYRQAWGNEFSKLLFTFSSTIEWWPPHSLKPGHEKERFVIVKPAPTNVYRDVLEDPEIQPTVIGGVWHPKLFEIQDDHQKKVILHFHGGAYVLGDCRDADTAFAARTLIASTSAMVFCPQYRLSSAPDGRFPAAIQDAMTAYQHLLDLGIPPLNIILSGDSAGGHLVISMLRYLHENENRLSPPSAALLWSPWVDLATDPKTFDHHRNTKTDFLRSTVLNWGIKTFVPSFMQTSHPYLTPSDSPFPTSVPIFVQLGSAEVFYDIGKRFAENMRGVQGNNIELYKVDNAPHDILLMGQILGFENEAAEAANAAQQFLMNRGVLSPSSA